jgi:hypothetical protein
VDPGGEIDNALDDNLRVDEATDDERVTGDTGVVGKNLHHQRQTGPREALIQVIQLTHMWYL